MSEKEGCGSSGSGAPSKAKRLRMLSWNPVVHKGTLVC